MYNRSVLHRVSVQIHVSDHSVGRENQVQVQRLHAVFLPPPKKILLRLILGMGE